MEDPSAAAAAADARGAYLMMTGPMYLCYLLLCLDVTVSRSYR
jgi:hypothetical protein